MYAGTIAYDSWTLGSVPTERTSTLARPPSTPLDRAMERYACGDASAFATLYEALHPRLCAFLVRMTGSRALADDLVQETFLRMHRARSTFADGGAVLPWAYAIARNVRLDHVRSQQRRATEELRVELCVEPTAESSAIASEVAQIVERTLARLPAAQREAFVLLRYEGLSVQDAASVLGATETAVKLRAFRAYEALRAAIEAAQRGDEGAPSGLHGAR